MNINKRGILVHPEDLTTEWIDWMQDAGLNTLGLHPVGGVNAHQSLQQAIDIHALPDSRLLRAKANRCGISVEYEAHVMTWLLPRSLYRRVPKWFRMDDKGERNPDFNMCASNPEALAYLAERTALLASLLDTGTSKYYFWLDDVKNCSCHCSECQKLTTSDQQLQILNAMLTGLKEYDKHAKLCFIAYHDTLEPPKTVMPLDGIFLEYAPINRNPHRPIFDSNCLENVHETRALRQLVDFFGTKDSRVLEYWMDNSLYSNWTKPPKHFQLDEEVMRQDVEFYASLGFEELTSFGCYLGPDYQQLYGNPSLKEYGDILMGK